MRTAFAVLAVVVVAALAATTASAYSFRNGIRPAWSHQFPSNVRTGLRIDYDGNFVVSTKDEVFVINRSGEVEWSALAPEGLEIIACDASRKFHSILCVSERHNFVYVEGEGLVFVSPEPVPYRYLDLLYLNEAIVVIIEGEDGEIFSVDVVFDDTTGMAIDFAEVLGTSSAYVTEGASGRTAGYSFDSGVITLHYEDSIICTVESEAFASPVQYGEIYEDLDDDFFVFFVATYNGAVGYVNSNCDFEVIFDFEVPVSGFPTLGTNGVLYVGLATGYIIGLNPVGENFEYNVGLIYNSIEGPTDMAFIPPFEDETGYLVYSDGDGRLVTLDLDIGEISTVYVGEHGSLISLRYEECSGFLYGLGKKSDFFAINMVRQPAAYFLFQCQRERYQDLRTLHKSERRRFRNAFFDNLESCGVDRPRNNEFAFSGSNSVAVTTDDESYANLVQCLASRPNALRTKRCGLVSYQAYDFASYSPCGCQSFPYTLVVEGRSFWKTFGERNEEELLRLGQRFAQAVVNNCNLYECDVDTASGFSSITNTIGSIGFRDYYSISRAQECIASQFFKVDRMVFKDTDIIYNP